ncbi:D-alanyl-lipoteichoic acid biosynthesis protein DltD [Clostridium sp. CTA-7]
MKKYRYFIIPIITITVFSFFFNRIIDKKYNELIGKKDLTGIKHTYNHLLRDRGGVLKDLINDEGDLMLLGSSELSSDVNQNPINTFPFKEANYDISIYGRAHTQSLQHSTILSSTKNINSKDKIAIIISAQWFDNEKGMHGNDFSVNFSELQFYQFFNNNKISEDSKKYYAERVSSLLKQSEEYGEEALYAKLYFKDNVISNIALFLLKPYYKFKEYMLEEKDKVQVIKTLKPLGDKNNTEKNLKDINWNEEYLRAEKEGAEEVKDNHINVAESYYDKYLKDNYDKSKDRMKGKELLRSKELDDFKLLLKVNNELGLKPLIILMPINGLYYDHLGWDIEKREEFYNTIEKVAKDQGFDVLNLQNKEYEKYYMYDVMHLGWKGWVNISEEMYKYFDER